MSTAGDRSNFCRMVDRYESNDTLVDLIAQIGTMPLGSNCRAKWSVSKEDGKVFSERSLWAFAYTCV